MIKTRKEFISYFRENYMPTVRKIEAVQGGGVDNPLRAEMWNNEIDALIKDRRLPRCAANWDNPFDRRK